MYFSISEVNNFHRFIYQTTSDSVIFLWFCVHRYKKKLICLYMHTFIYIAILQDIIIIKQTHRMVSLCIIIKMWFIYQLLFLTMFFILFTLTKHYTFKLRRKKQCIVKLIKHFHTNYLSSNLRYLWNENVMFLSFCVIGDFYFV